MRICAPYFLLKERYYYTKTLEYRHCGRFVSKHHNTNLSEGERQSMIHSPSCNNTNVTYRHAPFRAVHVCATALCKSIKYTLGDQRIHTNTIRYDVSWKVLFVSARTVQCSSHLSSTLLQLPRLLSWHISFTPNLPPPFLCDLAHV
jgi:hypothetical protein